MSYEQKVDKALAVIYNYGQIDGAHHKAWVIDQVVHALTGEEYEDWISDYKKLEDDPEAYEWDEGIPP